MFSNPIIKKLDDIIINIFIAVLKLVFFNIYDNIKPTIIPNNTPNIIVTGIIVIETKSNV